MKGEFLAISKGRSNNQKSFYLGADQIDIQNLMGNTRCLNFLDVLGVRSFGAIFNFETYPLAFR